MTPLILLLIAAILIAPHCTEREAKIYSLVSIIASMVLWAASP